MTATRLALPVKVILAVYLAALHAVCLCPSAAPARGGPAQHATAGHACCHDSPSSDAEREAAPTEHEHHAACRHCDGATLRPASEPSATIATALTLGGPVPTAWLPVASPPLAARPGTAPPPDATAPHPPLPVLDQTTVLVI